MNRVNVIEPCAIKASGKAIKANLVEVGETGRSGVYLLVNTSNYSFSSHFYMSTCTYTRLRPGSPASPKFAHTPCPLVCITHRLRSTRSIRHSERNCFFHDGQFFHHGLLRPSRSEKLTFFFTTGYEPQPVVKKQNFFTTGRFFTTGCYGCPTERPVVKKFFHDGSFFHHGLLQMLLPPSVQTPKTYIKKPPLFKNH